MTTSKVTAPKPMAVEELKEWTTILPREIRDDVEARLTERDALRAENERLTERLKITETWWRNAKAYGMRMEHSRNSLRGPLAQLKARVQKAEAENERLEGVIKSILRDEIYDRLKKAEAALERVKPLVEAEKQMDDPEATRLAFEILIDEAKADSRFIKQGFALLCSAEALREKESRDGK
jgi:FtsZ-binding cell division protein ZapB